METTIGGDRLGSGSKQNVSMRNYERSTHDLGYVFRTTMSAGTLVPFMSQVALPGDSFDINLKAEVMTLPTIGPLFGSYKVQLDIFECPVRLYQAKLHMNMLGIGMDMSKIYLPQIRVQAQMFEGEYTYDNTTQVNPSALLSYLNIRGLGQQAPGTTKDLMREFNAVPLLAYWDIFKQYYANKQEDDAYVIHNDMNSTNFYYILKANVFSNGTFIGDIVPADLQVDFSTNITAEYTVELPLSALGTEPAFNLNSIAMKTSVNGNFTYRQLWSNISVEYNTSTLDLPTLTATIRCSGWNFQGFIDDVISMDNDGYDFIYLDNNDGTIVMPKLVSFPLKNIDNMRIDILSDVGSNLPFIVDKDTYFPYGQQLVKGELGYPIRSSQEGLAVKTYQSDLFNNWISTEWIDGANGVNEVTAVSTTGDSFTIDALNLASKVYNMLNRIAISGGSYDDWLDAVYTHERSRGAENPVYQGSLIKELAFEEVISQSATDLKDSKQPLGTLAGRGRLTQKDKGGYIKINVSEPSYIIGIVSLTPRIDYSQGNAWDTNLKTMNDFHKPALDAIGYQDLITDQMAYFDTLCGDNNDVTFQSAGKQPAWINYMTNVNVCRGNFAIENDSMFMTLNRRYEYDGGGIKDLTTYIDPVKFNQIFAYSALDAQNFWVQIGCDITARRKMSAKIIPNL